MLTSIADQAIDFFDQLFRRTFTVPFEQLIQGRLKRKAVTREIEAVADAASQSLARLLKGERLSEKHVAGIIAGLIPTCDHVTIDEISNFSVTPDEIVDRLLSQNPIPTEVLQARCEAIYRVALHSVVQVLLQIGPVMAEWRVLNFSTTFEMPRRVANRLNQVNNQLEALRRAGQSAADERYELSYRDYLLQRFNRAEAGTVRMTTKMDVDLRELFVMPDLYRRPSATEGKKDEAGDADKLLDLSAARASFERGKTRLRDKTRDIRTSEENEGINALDQVKRGRRNVLIGAPGSGKSTFLEWLQVEVAFGKEEFVLAGQQAIPLLLRVRQLDPRNLPRGVMLIEKATASTDRATLMPSGWIQRQMKQGRVLFMLDGLDETELDFRDTYVLPWLREICEDYPDCSYIVSSRPVGYPPHYLKSLGFSECDLLDFNSAQITTYTRHWCTSVRLARNETEEEARREGAVDGEKIVERFESNPYIRNLARNPLMLSAICLVNYFEGGQLPKDRAMLYRLCVEGLLHHWDQRRGIYSVFTLDEKLRVCREVALAMQIANLAEYEYDKVRDIFVAVLGDEERGNTLLEHIRYRTGLLVERRPKVFAFAHLTFQEYLAARAIFEGNRSHITADRLVVEHNDGRWQEVIALYCGISPAPTTRQLIELLIQQADTDALGNTLSDAFVSSGTEITEDPVLRQKVIERIAIAPGHGRDSLQNFASEEVAPVANTSIGSIQGPNISMSYQWLVEQQEFIDWQNIMRKIKSWPDMTPFQLAELVALVHLCGPDNVLIQMLGMSSVYTPISRKSEHESFNLC